MGCASSRRAVLLGLIVQENGVNKYIVFPESPNGRPVLGRVVQMPGKTTPTFIPRYRNAAGKPISGPVGSSGAAEIDFALFGLFAIDMAMYDMAIADTGDGDYGYGDGGAMGDGGGGGDGGDGGGGDGGGGD